MATKPRVEWQPDDAVTDCNQCKKAFTFFRRRVCPLKKEKQFYLFLFVFSIIVVDVERYFVMIVVVIQYYSLLNSNFKANKECVTTVT